MFMFVMSQYWLKNYLIYSEILYLWEVGLLAPPNVLTNIFQSGGIVGGNGCSKYSSPTFAF